MLHCVSCCELSVYVCPKSFLCTRWEVTRRWEVLISTSRIHHLVTDKSERPDHLKSNHKLRSLDQSCNKVVDVTGQVHRRPVSCQLVLSPLSRIRPAKSPLLRLLNATESGGNLYRHVKLSMRSVVSVQDLSRQTPDGEWGEGVDQHGSSSMVITCNLAYTKYQARSSNQARSRCNRRGAAIPVLRFEYSRYDTSNDLDKWTWDYKNNHTSLKRVKTVPWRFPSFIAKTWQEWLLWEVTEISFFRTSKVLELH